MAFEVGQYVEAVVNFPTIGFIKGSIHIIKADVSCCKERYDIGLKLPKKSGCLGCQINWKAGECVPILANMIKAVDYSLLQELLINELKIINDELT